MAFIKPFHLGIKAPVVNISAVCRLLGWLLLIEAAFMVIPLATSLIYGENDAMAFVESIAITAGAGLLAILCFRPRLANMGKREGFLLTALVWVVFSAFGMLPLLIGPTPLTVSEGFFEAMSGFTTTGATVIGQVSTLTHGIQIWRCLMQWLGGMGIIMFTLAVLPKFNHSGGLMMFNAEVTGITHDKISPRISQTAKTLWMIYLILTIVLICLLLLGPMNLFESICHAMSTISTGGYSTSDGSIGTWDDSYYTKIVITIFMFIGGINFGLLFATVHGGGLRTLWRNDIFRTYVYVILGMFILFDIAIIVRDQFHDLQDITIEPIFQIVSTITSTGYTVTNFESWGTTVLVLVFLLMFIGACAGSTTGGAKLDRIRCVMVYTWHQLRMVVNPNEVHTVRVNGRVISRTIIGKIMSFIVIYMVTIFFSAILLTGMHVPLVDAFFSTFSCMGNNGLGAGITGYGSSYDIIPDAGKWVLSIVMLIGRLEIFTIFVLFVPEFWRK